MKAFLIQITTRGVRNITKNIALDFADYGIPKKAHPAKSNVKGIYGTNGSGKTALLISMMILESLSRDKEFLVSHKTLLERILNKKTQLFYARLVFMIYDDKNNNQVDGTYSYEIQLEKKEGQFLLTQESFKKLLGRTINETSHERTLFETEKGILRQYAGPDFEVVKTRTLNLLSFSTFSSLGFPAILKNFRVGKRTGKDQKPTLWEEDLFSLFLVFRSMVFSIDKNRYPISMIREYDHLSASQSFLDSFGFLSEGISEGGALSNLFVNGSILVSKKDFAFFQKYIEKLQRFLSLFKLGLKKIEIERRVDKENYLCRLFFVYQDYRIDFDQESSGIKKLVSMFQALKACAQGDIAFIDGIDNGINDVYLEKIIEYFVLYGKGQLIFTSHDLYLMDKLKNSKHSIDFLNEDGELISWTRGGKLNPANRYREGCIPQNPMNIDAMDFLPVFGKVEEK